MREIYVPCMLLIWNYDMTVCLSAVRITRLTCLSCVAWNELQYDMWLVVCLMCLNLGEKDMCYGGIIYVMGKFWGMCAIRIWGSTWGKTYSEGEKACMIFELDVKMGLIDAYEMLYAKNLTWKWIVKLTNMRICEMRCFYEYLGEWFYLFNYLGARYESPERRSWDNSIKRW